MCKNNVKSQRGISIFIVRRNDITIRASAAHRFHENLPSISGVSFCSLAVATLVGGTLTTFMSVPMSAVIIGEIFGAQVWFQT